MLVSVIIPTFNRANLISRALDSVFTQTNLSAGVDLEVLVVDDGSFDNTASLVASQYSNATLLIQENAGVSAARNVGLEEARGDWITLLDSDDEWLPHKLSRQIAEVERTGLQVCHTEELWIRDGVRVNQMNKHKKQGGWIYQQCLPLCAMSPSSIMIHRSVFDEVGVFDEALPACEDYDLWLRIAARYEVAYIAEPCINKYGGHADQLSRQHWGMDRFRVVALERCLTDPEVYEYLNSEQFYATRKNLIKKLEILLTGALKRRNEDLEKWCVQKLAVYREFSQ